MNEEDIQITATPRKNSLHNQHHKYVQKETPAVINPDCSNDVMDEPDVLESDSCFEQNVNDTVSNNVTQVSNPFHEIN